jgi:hypothetical protein
MAMDQLPLAVFQAKDLSGAQLHGYVFVFALHHDLGMLQAGPERQLPLLAFCMISNWPVLPSRKLPAARLWLWDTSAAPWTVVPLGGKKVAGSCWVAMCFKGPEWPLM